MNASEKQTLCIWAVMTLIIFVLGWAISCFIAWDWTLPLASTWSRLGLIAAMVFAGWVVAHD